MNHAHPFLYEQSQQEIIPIIDYIEVDSLYESFEVQALRVRTEQPHVQGSPVLARSEVPSNKDSIFKLTPGASKRSVDYSNAKLNHRFLKILGNWGEKQHLSDRIRDLQLRSEGIKGCAMMEKKLKQSRGILGIGRKMHESIKEKLANRSIIKKQSLNLLTSIYNRLQSQSAFGKIGSTMAE